MMVVVTIHQREAVHGQVYQESVVCHDRWGLRGLTGGIIPMRQLRRKAMRDVHLTWAEWRKSGMMRDHSQRLRRGWSTFWKGL